MQKIRIALVLALTATTSLAFAGDLTPPEELGPTMRSLDEIYNKLDDKSGGFEEPTDDHGTGKGIIHLTLTAETQGEVTGGSEVAGREGSIIVIGFSHEVVSPRDAASGLPTGKRQHKPIRITKYIDKATPLLYAIHTGNENIPELKLDFYRQGRSGNQELFYTIELVNASIAGMKADFPNLEEVEFTYQQIIWTWAEGGITAEDDWETPVAK